MNKKIHIIGGGTIEPVRPHLALSAPAYGGTARRLARICRERDPYRAMDVVLHLTRMAGGIAWHPLKPIETNADLETLAAQITADPLTKIVFFNAAVADFRGQFSPWTPEGRLHTHNAATGLQNVYTMNLTPAPKILSGFRRFGYPGAAARKDIFLIGFKATSAATESQQYQEGLNLLKRSSCNLVLANDTGTRVNMIVVPEEAAYCVTTDRARALTELVDMAFLRSHLTFTRSTVVDGRPVAWDSPLVPDTLRRVVDYCIDHGAYKRFLGVTAGHFAVKINETTFLTSRRKTDFNDMKETGLVMVKTDGPDSVLAYGSKPSVGGQSQRIVFAEHPDADCIVHFHCPLLPDSPVPVVSQREYECGSHECGANTSRGLRRFGNLSAVYLDRHGPNIVFSSRIDPGEVIRFIADNFDLSAKTGGYQITQAAL